uniref:Uncharacterized protein n=1 Tax=Romanomermis culicivorax TaxID=13658 RepID=A0A915IB03_ROMCU
MLHFLSISIILTFLSLNRETTAFDFGENCTDNDDLKCHVKQGETIVGKLDFSRLGPVLCGWRNFSGEIYSWRNLQLPEDNLIQPHNYVLLRAVNSLKLRKHLKFLSLIEVQSIQAL